MDSFYQYQTNIMDSIWSSQQEYDNINDNNSTLRLPLPTSSNPVMIDPLLLNIDHQMLVANSEHHEYDQGVHTMPNNSQRDVHQHDTHQDPINQYDPYNVDQHDVNRQAIVQRVLDQHTPDHQPLSFDHNTRLLLTPHDEIQVVNYYDDRVHKKLPSAPTINNNLNNDDATTHINSITPRGEPAPPVSQPAARHQVLESRVTKSTPLRGTCQTCRALHIRCVAGTKGGGCEKCAQKGIPCVFKPRAVYGSKVKGKK